MRSAIQAAGFAMPMLCCSPDFTHPDAERRAQAVAYQQGMIRVAHTLGGAGTVCRVLSGQAWPEITREQGLAYASQGIIACLPLAEDLGVVLGLENHYKDGFWRYAEFARRRKKYFWICCEFPSRPILAYSMTPATPWLRATIRWNCSGRSPREWSACMPATAI